MTPNSFSERGISRLQSFLDRPEVIIDVGFESTAPMNKPISAEEEMERFENFLVLSKNFQFEGRVLSFDTYRPLNFLTMKKRFSDVHQNCRFIFNDVSGVIDDDLMGAMKTDGDFLFVYSCAHIPSRDRVHDHMSFLTDDDAVADCLESFKQAWGRFKQEQLTERLILDPGFGFSKSYDQNWSLINRFNELVSGLVNAGIDAPLLIGLSKKSFLRKALKTESFEESEHLHFKCMVDLLKTKALPLLFRVHNPEIVALARRFSL